MQKIHLPRVARVAAAWQSGAMLCALAFASVAADSTKVPVPTPQQLAWHEAEIGLFFHWAPNVYQGGEGDNLSTPRDQINPDRFDAAQWVQAVKGRYLRLVYPDEVNNTKCVASAEIEILVGQ